MSNTANTLRYKHRQCYANPLGGCSGRLTKEHYISAGVLRRIGKSGGIYLRDFPWQDQPHKSEWFPINRLSARILCKGHHKALNNLNLDDAACRLLDDLIRSFQGISGQLTSPLNLVSHHSGQCIELWLLKVLCGVFAAGVAPRPAPNITIPAQSVPLPLLRVLFGLDKFSQGCGLYIQSPARHPIRINMSEGFTFTWQGVKPDIHACFFSFFSLGFMLIIDQSALKDPELPLQDWGYRPSSLQFDKSETNTHVKLMLDW